MTISTTWVDPSPAGSLDLATGDVVTETWVDGVASDLLSMGGAKGLLPFCQGRLTLASGCPVTVSDVSNATSVLFTPYQGDRVSLYDGTLWKTLSFTEITHALGTVTSAMGYDFFLYASGSTVLMEKEVWSTSSSRLKDLAYQNGRLVKSGCPQSLYVGSIYTTSTTQVQDTAAQRHCFSYYHRARKIVNAKDSSDWTYTTAVFRARNNNTSDGTGRFSVMVGWADEPLVCQTGVEFYNSTGANVEIGIGVDSTSAIHAESTEGVIYDNEGDNDTPIAFLVANLSIGYHYIQALEKSQATGTSNWWGSRNAAVLKGVFSC